MRIYLILFALCVSGLIPLSRGQCQEDDKIFARAVEYVKTGDADSAFMSLHTLVSSYPGSPHAQGALFAMGEYYFRVSDLRDASGSFYRMAKEYPDSPAVIFCYAYLLNISRQEKKEKQVKAFERALVDAQRLIFLFTESKQFVYNSVSGATYRAVYFIDRVEIYADGALFTTVSY